MSIARSAVTVSSYGRSQMSVQPTWKCSPSKRPLVAWSRPLRGGRYRCEVVDTIPAAEARDIWATTQRCAWDLERIVRHHPSCWVLNYNFFSNRPRPEDLATLPGSSSRTCTR